MHLLPRGSDDEGGQEETSVVTTEESERHREHQAVFSNFDTKGADAEGASGRGNGSGTGPAWSCGKPGQAGDRQQSRAQALQEEGLGPWH